MDASDGVGPLIAEILSSYNNNLVCGITITVGFSAVRVQNPNFFFPTEQRGHSLVIIIF